MNVPNIYEYYRHFMLKWRRNILTSPQKQNNNIDTGRLIWLNGGKRNKKKYQHMSVLYVRKNTHTKQNQKKKRKYDLHKTKCHVRNDKYLNGWSENL